jgi:hypothetical protein
MPVTHANPVIYAPSGNWHRSCLYRGVQEELNFTESHNNQGKEIRFQDLF